MAELSLLPCPHCGGEPQELQHDCQFWIQCTNCHGVDAQTCVHTSQEDAVAAWNKRSACVPDGPENWSDAQVIEFLAVALRHVNVSGVIVAQDIRDGFRFMSSKGQGHDTAHPGAHWVAVPWQITTDMVVAFADTWYRKRRSFDDPEMDDAYAAMLQAAPNPPQQRGAVSVPGLNEFAVEILRGTLEGSSFDGGDIQEMGVRHGLLFPEKRTERCGEHCECAEYGFPIECFRIARALLATPGIESGGQP